jgi:SAM-dependent methyltransferase
MASHHDPSGGRRAHQRWFDFRSMTLKSRLVAGVAIGPFLVSVRRRSGSTADPISNGVLRRQVQRMAVLFPALRDVTEPVLTAEPASVSAVLAFCNEYVALFHEPGREVQVRNLLVRLRASLDETASRNHVDTLIARSDLRSGVVDRALRLRSLPEDDPVRQVLDAAAVEHDELYGSAAGMIRERKSWEGLAGDTRGASLVARFEHHPDELRGKSILHVAPEVESRRWLKEHAADLRLTYTTLDAFGAGEDLRADLTELTLPDGCFDLVICHRVLEHVLDDGAALREIHRVLRTGGRLETSVPQSMQLLTTNEWVIQDESHHGHVRQYGRDFEARLADAGFRVELDRLLLDRMLSEHLVAGTYPLRIYNCWKD